MVRKVKATSTYVNLTSEDVEKIVLATSGSIKDKAVDPRKLVGTIHVKKYLADTKINGKVETWVSLLKKLSATPAPELTSDEVDAFEECKKAAYAYLEEEASSSLKKKVSETKEEVQNLKDIASSMKFKFSRHSYEVVTHVINLMLRELVVFTCDSCATQKNKLTKVSHVPWVDLQTKLLAGLYMNTKTVFEAVHPKPVESEESESEEVPETEATSSDEVEVEASTDDDVDADVKQTKPRLSQYISNTFKEIVSRDERFKGLLLGKEVTALFNDIIFQVLDRYANVIKSLLQTANSKTVNERLALIATKILLQDHIHATDADVGVVLDVVQARLEELKASPEPEEVEATPAAPVSPSKGKKSSKQ